MIAEFAVFPLDGEHLSEEVARAVDELQTTGLNFRIGPMGTTVEGNCSEVFSAIQKCYERLTQDHERVILTMTVDGRKTKAHDLSEMVPTVQRKLKHSFSKNNNVEMVGKYHVLSKK